MIFAPSVVVGYEVEQSPIISRFAAEAQKRFNGAFFASGAKVRYVVDKGEGKGGMVLLFWAKPAFSLDLSSVALALAGIWLLFSFSLWWYVVPLLFACASLFQNNLFYAQMVRMGINKAGYSGQCKRIAMRDLIGRVV